MKFRVKLIETVSYTVDVEAEDEHEAMQKAEAVWCASENPTEDFNGEGRGVQVRNLWELR